MTVCFSLTIVRQATFFQEKHGLNLIDVLRNENKRVNEKNIVMQFGGQWQSRQLKPFKCASQPVRIFFNPWRNAINNQRIVLETPLYLKVGVNSIFPQIPCFEKLWDAVWFCVFPVGANANR